MTTYGISDPDQGVTIDYTNWRGERSKRRIVPWKMMWGSNEWYPEYQWLLRAYDVEKKETREFAMTGVHSWSK